MLIAKRIREILVKNIQKQKCLLHTTLSCFAQLLSPETPRIKCTLIPGDGVGPELVDSVLQVFKAASIPVDFEKIFISEINPQKSAPLETVMKSIQNNGVCLNGVFATPHYLQGGELESVNMKMRRALDLYANVVHIQSIPGLKTRHEGVDFVVVREQTEGEYSSLEHESVKGIVESLKIVTGRNSSRIAKFAFDYALKHGRRKVTAVHKANIMKLGDGLFLRSCGKVARMYPKIEFDHMIVDNCSMQMISNPQKFDVVVTMNLYGCILDNLGAGMVGGAGVVPGALYSPNCVIFEPGARHIFAEGIGKDVANPTAMLLCSVKLLRHVNLTAHADLIRAAVRKVLLDGKIRTQDLGGQATTKEYTQAVIDNLKIPK